MAHDERPSPRTREKAAEFRAHLRARDEAARPAEAVVGRDPGRRRPAVQTAAEKREEERFRAIATAPRDPLRGFPAAAQIDRSLRGDPPCGRDHRLAHGGQEMHVLVPVDVIGRASERLVEGGELAFELRAGFGPGARIDDQKPREPAEGGELARRCQNGSVAQGLLIGERQVQADVDPVAPRKKRLRRLRPARALGHAGNGGEAPGLEQLEDPGVHTGRQAVIVGAEDQRSRRTRPVHAREDR